MYLVVIAWLYVTIMMAVAEATSTTGSLLGAAITFVLYGLLPLSIVVYILGTPGRRRAIHAREMAERAAAAQEASAAASADPDARGEAPAAAEGGTVAPVRKEP
ncbi:hypothetical protein B2J86_00855 [Acidovorax sp. SRB_14]|uniref:hypothetical protein n=1 Tax=unclassified Acidovorax TaxID=2684926 RepID=UPI00145CA38C|nr:MULTISPECIES: hypothetical protein [unclassified Acidovorax]NMM77026.1 hypothetical protein [Acidovorax sp. SRB_24]NMM79491.1 hypothetical protein [Acidovorax sp. SRB_14]NMM84743.1 hypothetical protein [Rhodococcus sp. SRB_17]